MNPEHPTTRAMLDLKPGGSFDVDQSCHRQICLLLAAKRNHVKIRTRKMETGVLRVWKLALRGVGSEVIERSHARLPALRLRGRPGHERGKKYTTGRDAAFSEGVLL